MTENSTLRPVSPGAEKYLYKDISILDHGVVSLIDYMGTDLSIDEAARTSYGAGTRQVSETQGLVRYLRRHAHTSPFEMVELKFFVKMPIFVARQWVRHRTASLNEYSARYSIVPEEYYIPVDEDIALQSVTNNQGRGDIALDDVRQLTRYYMMYSAEEAYGYYQKMIDEGVAREIARGVLGTQYYTQMVWKVDLHNLMHFLRLRLDSHAQKEIRVYAEAMATIVKEAWPISWKAFEDYELNSIKLTSLETACLREIMTGATSPELVIESHIANKRERGEALEKFKTLGVIK